MLGPPRGPLFASSRLRRGYRATSAAPSPDEQRQRHDRNGHQNRHVQDVLCRREPRGRVEGVVGGMRQREGRECDQSHRDGAAIRQPCAHEQHNPRRQQPRTRIGSQVGVVRRVGRHEPRVPPGEDVEPVVRCDHGPHAGGGVRQPQGHEAKTDPARNLGAQHRSARRGHRREERGGGCHIPSSPPPHRSRKPRTSCRIAPRPSGGDADCDGPGVRLCSPGRRR